MKEDLKRYKYLPFSEGSLSVITDGTMKFSAPSEFNDPFDCVPDIDPKSQVEYASKNNHLVKKACKELGYSPAQCIQNKKKLLKRIENACDTPEYINYFSNKIGVCSLSRNPLNILMWSHYAEKHSGFVVEFSIPQASSLFEHEVDEYILENLFPLEVKYSNKKPIINPFDDKDLNMEKNFLTKSIDWEYEEEERVIDYVRGPGIHDFNRKRVISSVIAGLKISSENYNKLESVVTMMNKKLNTKVMLHKVNIEKGAFKLNCQGLTYE